MPAEAKAFLQFYAEHAVPHFREEEEWLFPLVADSDEAQPQVVRALLEHQRLHALAARLRSGDTAIAAELAELLEAHVRFEERELFPLLERIVGGGLAAAAAHEGSGPVWGTESEDLNATLLVWSPGDGTPEHVNRERDVLVLVVEGSATLTVDGESSELNAGRAAIVAKGTSRRIEAGPRGVRYLSAHVRRPPLQIQARPTAAG